MKSKTPPPEFTPPNSYTAVTVVRVDQYFNYAIEITVVNGAVTNTKILNEAPDVQAAVIGKASSSLWKMLAGE